MPGFPSSATSCLSDDLPSFHQPRLFLSRLVGMPAHRASDSGLLRTTLHSFMHGEAMAHQVWPRQHVLLQRRIDPIQVNIRDKPIDAGIEAHRLRAKHEAAVAQQVCDYSEVADTTRIDLLRL